MYIYIYLFIYSYTSAHKHTAPEPSTRGASLPSVRGRSESALASFRFQEQLRRGARRASVRRKCHERILEVLCVLDWRCHIVSGFVSDLGVAQDLMNVIDQNRN